MSVSDPKIIILGIVALISIMIFQAVQLPAIYSLVPQLLVLGIFCVQYRRLSSAQYRDANDQITKSADEAAGKGYPTPEVAVTLSQIYTELAQISQIERGLINDEIARVTKLVHSAVKGISHSVHQIKLSTERQQTMLKKLVSVATVKTDNVPGKEKRVAGSNCDKQLSDSIATFSATTEHMAQSVTQAIQFLQFEDLTNQALQSLSDNISQFDAISGELNRLSVSEQSIELQLEQLRTLCGSLRVKASKGQTYPTVSQYGMAEGEVELF